MIFNIKPSDRPTNPSASQPAGSVFLYPFFLCRLFDHSLQKLRKSNFWDRILNSLLKSLFKILTDCEACSFPWHTQRYTNIYVTTKQ